MRNLMIEFPMKDYEFTLENIPASQDNYEYWSPPLPTAINMCWQLKFMNRIENYKEYCVLGVYAIPNEQELKNDLAWSVRKAFHIYIYIRTEEMLLRKDYTPTNMFNNSRKFIIGWNTIIRKPKLPKKFTIGIEFKRSENYKFIKPLTNVNQDLIDAWTEFYNTEEEDPHVVELIINEIPDQQKLNEQPTRIIETIISKTFLSKRSSYCGDFYFEETKMNLNVTFAEAYMEFIRYLYTDQICFSNSINLTNELLDIANEYEANELKDRINEMIVT